MSTSLLRPSLGRASAFLLQPSRLLLQLGRRSLLSAAYACQDVWQAQRQTCDSLKHISPSRYFFELNNKFNQRSQSVSAVDVDIYLNSLHRAENADELEHIVRRFRASRQTVNALPSTSHAVCRFYLGLAGKRAALLKILNQRVEYGIFADHFIANIAMDGALKEHDLEAAFEIVKLMMLQEDPGNEVTKTLAMHTLIQLLKSDAILPNKDATDATEDPPAEEQELDDEDIEYIRVPYLTNAYFDDHFDLTDRAAIFGKSLYFFGLHVANSLSSNSSEEDRILGATSQIIGLLYYQKWDKLDRLLKGRLGKQKITREAVETALKLQKQQQVLTSSEADEMQKVKDSVVSRVEALAEASNSSETLSSLLAVRIAALPSHEAKDIADQKELFASFEAARQASLTDQLNRLLAEQRAAQLQEQQTELAAKRRLYYFFEHLPQHEIDFVQAEQRIAELAANTVVDEDYVPPEI